MLHSVLLHVSVYLVFTDTLRQYLFSIYEYATGYETGALEEAV
jgi:hypothetical protein